MKKSVIWYTAPCVLGDFYQSFRETRWLSHENSTEEKDRISSETSVTIYISIQVMTYPREMTVFLGTKLKLNSVALFRERTIPTERPPPVGEVSANFCG